ncbi:tRNA nucleotidyltransferase (CCA-adding enzyme) [Paenibacillus sp. UNCCL117]|uniref:CCA tRNA nucleotidyltransferase n=1 Tax=unclassified Paenibacillus TaxID=185978 RepID=UPI000887FA1F|nr:MULTISPECIES: CCA tRNA nucleotidyltransferase [unclassified Paenibacillus]SDC41746.1 tRNA nucleotidyltransferase (CCA-adding enzyme) [Paenibacillus sp. cl123]SFW13440.1 tRNA nucleotidyltransferase (CCA-adding enzyme) [Paenibacillus sp. UNCCL117]
MAESGLEKQRLLKEHALQIVARLGEAGYEAYLVGGCVRDEWLKRPVKDYDIATSAVPERVVALFERTVPTGLQHGTVTVVLGKQPFEVTTFRKEAGYADYRRPQSVEYITELEEDLRRRDFTMNAMAMDVRGQIVDPFGGREDLERGLLRCVGSAAERFSEDALRMLRCIRFAAEYGLEVEEESWAALTKSAPLLAHIAMERVRAELERMMAGRDPNRALRLLAGSKLLRYSKSPLLWGQLSGPEEPSAWPGLDPLPDAEHRLAYVYGRLSATPQQCQADMKLLTFSGRQIGFMTAILAARDWLAEQGRAAEDAGSAPERSAARVLWLRAAVRFGKPALGSLLRLLRLDPSFAAGAAEPFVNAWTGSGASWLEGMPVATLAGLAVTGQDVLHRLQLRGGPWTGQLLHDLLEKTAVGLLPNEKDALLDAAEELYHEYRETD